jgi:hypothetical protein
MPIRFELFPANLAAALWHNQLIGQPGRHLAPSNH